MPDLRDDVRGLFAAITGREPDGLWSSPGRLALLRGDDGSSLSIAIDRRTIVAAGARDDASLRVVSTEFDEAVEIPLAELGDVRGRAGWVGLPLGVAWALGRSGADLAAVPGVDLVIESNVPVGAGLGSSAALASAVALALDDLWRLGFDRPRLAECGQLAEAEFAALAPAPGDYAATLFGRHDAALLVDARGEVESIDVDFASAGVTLLLIETGRAETGEAPTPPTVPADRFGLAVDALRKRDLAEFARLVDEPSLATVELTLAAETAREHGAAAARATTGGSLIAAVSGDAVSRIQVALDGAFAEHGYRAPEVYPVRPSDSAARDT